MGDEAAMPVVVLPLPGHRETTAQDGSLPSQIADAVATGLGALVRRDLLHHRPREQQVKHTNPADRAALLENAYYVPEGTVLDGTRFVLVDESVDTGSTASAACGCCTSGCHHHGTVEVHAMRTMMHEAMQRQC